MLRRLIPSLLAVSLSAFAQFGGGGIVLPGGISPPGGQYPGGQYPGGQYLRNGGQYPTNGQCPNGQAPVNGQCQGGQHPGGQMPNGRNAGMGTMLDGNLRETS